MRLQGRTYAVLVAEGVEDLEYWVTVMRLREEGATVVSAGSDTERHRGKNGLAVRADALASDIDAESLDGLVITGGFAPDKLRRDPAVLDLVRKVHARGLPIGIICHGGSRDLGRHRRRPGDRINGDQGRPRAGRRRMGRRAGVP